MSDQLASTTGFVGLLITFDAKGCCKIAKIAMESNPAALELLTAQEGRTSAGRAGPRCYVVFPGMFRGAVLGGFCYTKIHAGLGIHTVETLQYFLI